MLQPPAAGQAALARIQGTFWQLIHHTLGPRLFFSLDGDAISLSSPTTERSRTRIDYQERALLGRRLINLLD